MPFWKRRRVEPWREQEQRFTEIYELDRKAPLPYAMAPRHDAGAARQRVRQLVESLQPGGVDEGTDAALDPLIQSWTAGWLAGIDSEHADHKAVIDMLIGSAKEQAARATATHTHDRYRLELARRDHREARRRLGDDEPDISPDEPPTAVPTKEDNR